MKHSEATRNASTWPAYSSTVPSNAWFTFHSTRWNMLLLTTNIDSPTYYVSNKTFEPAEVACFITHTQGLP